MSQDKLPEIYTNDVDSVDPTTGLGRTGIPHRVGRDLWVLDEEGIRVKEGDTLEVIYRGNIKTWTAILDEDNALVNSEDLEPLSGSLDTSLLLLESANQESLSNYIPQSNRRLLTLVSHPPRANLANLEPLSLDIVMGQSYMSSPEAPNLVSPSRKDDEIRVLPPQVRALVNITAKEKTELSYKKGDIIDVVLRNISDVWQGKLGSQAGTFRLDNSVEPILKERVRALWDYDAASPNDLTFNSGDIIEVCGPSNASNWWIHGWMPNRGFGLFPFNFVEGIEDEFPDDDEGLTLSSSEPTKGKVSTRFRVLKDVVGSEEASLSLKQGDIIDLVEKQTRDKWLGKVRSQTGTFQLDNNIEPIMTDRVMAIFSYNATNPEELSFIEGDCITVVGPSDDSTLWWYGTLKGRVGLFPYNYVDLIPDDQDSDSDDGNEAEAPQTLRALHNFSSKDPAILNFDVNDVIKVIDAGTTDEWWTGEINGRVGLFPRTYCEETAEKIEDLSQDFPSAKNDSKVDVHRVAGLPSPKLSTLPEVETPMFELMVSKDSSNGILIKERSEEGNQGSQTRIPDESLFPGSPVRPSQDPHQNPDKKGSKDKEALLKAEWVRARHLWNSDKPKELTLQAGDIIQVLKRPYEHWWKGRLERDGQVGLFPVNFVEAVPPPLPPPKRRSSVLDSNEAVIALRSTLAKLHPLLRHFDTTQDLADNAQIQELFRTSVILRRKVKRLLGENPDDDGIQKLDSLFQDVKRQYESVMEHCAKRAVEQDASQAPNIPKSKPVLVPESPNMASDSHSVIGGTHRVELPPTPPPDSSSSEAWSSSLADMLNKRWSQGEGRIRKRYSGRLSGLEADIKRAKQGYQESIRSQEETKSRRLPNPDKPIAIIRSVFDRRPSKGPGTEVLPGKKTIHLPKVEYIHNHIVYENQQPLRKG